MILLLYIFTAYNNGLYALSQQRKHYPDHIETGRMFSVFLLNAILMPITILIGLLNKKLSILGLSNYLFFQFFFIRLAKKIDTNNNKIGWAILNWAEPYSGWDNDFKYL